MIPIQQMAFPAEGVPASGNAFCVNTTYGKLLSTLSRCYLLTGSGDNANTGNVTLFAAINSDANNRRANCSSNTIIATGLGITPLGMVAVGDTQVGGITTAASTFVCTLLNGSGNTTSLISNNTLRMIVIEATAGSAGANVYGGVTYWDTSKATLTRTGGSGIIYTWDVSSNTNLPWRWTNVSGNIGAVKATFYF